MAKNELTINVTVNGVEDIEKLTREFEKLKALVGADKINVESSEPTYRLVSGRDARVGDFVKFTEAPFNCLTSDKYYEIKEIDSRNDAHIIDDDGDVYDTCGDSFDVYEKVTEAPAEPEPLKVGDYAKVLIDDLDGKDAVVKISRVDEDDFDYRPYLSTTGYWYKTEDIVKATEEEIAEAKAKFERQQTEAKEAGRWAKIGRKPNEYKVGDIVGTEHYGLFEITAIDERLEHPIHGIIFGNKDAIKKEGITLITPVEARFDRA